MGGCWEFFPPLPFRTQRAHFCLICFSVQWLLVSQSTTHVLQCTFSSGGGGVCHTSNPRLKSVCLARFQCAATLNCVSDLSFMNVWVKEKRVWIFYICKKKRWLSQQQAPGWMRLCWYGRTGQTQGFTADTGTWNGLWDMYLFDLMLISRVICTRGGGRLQHLFVASVIECDTVPLWYYNSTLCVIILCASRVAFDGLWCY